MRRPEYAWMLPSALEAPAPAPAKRSTRDWIVDTVLFLAGLVFTVYALVELLRPGGELGGFDGGPVWLTWVDFGFSVIAAAGLWWRRRFPLLLCAYCGVIGTFSIAAGVTGLIMLFTVALHRRFAWVAVAYLSTLATNSVFSLLRPERGVTYVEGMAWASAVVAIIMLWGMVLRSRRQLVLSLRDRAERAEAEQQLRVSQARALERTRIAREMHDVLAHRISLLSLHAGALEIRTGATPDEVATAAGVIRASAHQALEDLREVIGVLREVRPGDAAPEPPQPTLGELAALADESRSAGTQVRLEVGVEPAAVPVGAGRAAYRIVQEGLTNARKHAPGAHVSVAVAGSAGDGLTIDVRNPWPVGRPAAPIPGTGTGLIGLAERAALAGGRLTHGRTRGDEFTLSAWLPWPAATDNGTGPA